MNLRIQELNATNLTEFQDNTGECIPTDFDNVNWSIDNNTLSLISSDGTENPVTFFELTETILKFESDSQEVFCEDSIGSSVYFEFKKIE